MAKYTHDIVATMGEYTAGNGEKKKRFTNVGKAFTDDQGRISLKIETVPVGPDWSGWLSLYPRREDDRSSGHGGGQRAAAPVRTGAGQAAPVAEDDGDAVPF